MMVTTSTLEGQDNKGAAQSGSAVLEDMSSYSTARGMETGDGEFFR